MQDKFGPVYPTDCKPFKGHIDQWWKDYGNPPEKYASFGLGYIIRGRSIDHPEYGGMGGVLADTWFHTSYVVAHNEETGEIETRNSKYTLVGPSIGKEQQQL